MRSPTRDSCMERSRHAAILTKVSFAGVMKRRSGPTISMQLKGPRRTTDLNAQSNEGFMYGKVTTRSNTYEGQLRWGNEEAFWTDYFNAAKRSSENYRSECAVQRGIHVWKGHDTQQYLRRSASLG